MHACMCTGPPCMTRGLLRVGMGASDWDSPSQLLCLLAEVHLPNTVTGALTMYEHQHMCATGFNESQFASLFAGSIQTSKELEKIQHLQIGRPSNTIIFYLSPARSLERVTGLVSITHRHVNTKFFFPTVPQPCVCHQKAFAMQANA
jgi:hypothetical protein